MSAGGEPAIEVANLVKRYEPRPGEPGRKLGPVVALEGVSFRLARGRTLGIIGRNGSGKTTLLKLLAGTLAPSAGTVTVRGTRLGFIEIGGGFDEALTGRENVLLYGTFLGLKRREVSERIPEVARFAGLSAELDRPFASYSSGMRMRLAFSTALLKDPDVLLLDEVLAVGDEEFQHKSFRRIDELKRRGKTIVLVSHSVETVRGFCDEALCLERGRVVASGDASTVIATYLDRVWIAEREQILGDTDARAAEMRELDERMRQIEERMDAGTWLPTRFRTVRERSTRHDLEEALRDLRADLDDRFQRVITFLQGRAALGRDLALRERFAAADLEALGRVLDEASRFYGDPHRTEEVLVRWKELAYREVERATLDGERAAELRARRLLVAALTREVEVHEGGPARDRAVLERLEALAGLQRASEVGDAAALLEMIDVAAAELLGRGSIRTDGVAAGALQQLEGIAHDLFRDERAGAGEARRAVFERWLDRLGGAPPELFRRVNPRWMVERVREHAARGALDGEAGELRWLTEAEERLLGAAAGEGAAGAAASGPLRIHAVRFLDASGAAIEEVVSGAPLTIELAFEAAEPLDSPMFGVGLHEPGGLLLAAPNTSASRAEVGTVRGRGVVLLEVESLPLTAGVYPVSVSAMSRAGDQMFDYHDRRYRLRVVDPGGAEVLGRIRLPTRWTVRHG
ncbi:MAG: ABC transporter ATP-binding protein [Deltaproteobacteria bacterium]|nr:ABC transporter ATP-binding protein [Deltaproteobacteria bacterium]